MLHVRFAKHVGLSKVFIPATASVFSAFGMLAADAVRDYSLTVMYSAQVDTEQLEADFMGLEQKAVKDLMADGFGRGTIQLERQIDARYRGQSFEITVPYTLDYQAVFHSTHKSLYGYARPEGRVEIVNLRVTGVGKSNPVHFGTTPSGALKLENAQLGIVEIYQNPLDALPASVPELVSTPTYRGEMLPEGAVLPGPVLIVRKDTTIFAGQGDLVTVTKHVSLIIDVGRGL